MAVDTNYCLKTKNEEGLLSISLKQFSKDLLF